jgi:peroxiredoxin
MKALYWLVTSLLCLSVSALAQQPREVPITNVKVGEIAPSFALKDQNDRLVDTSDFREKKKVVLVFFAYAFAPEDAEQLSKFRDEQEKFQDCDAEVTAVSTDHVYAGKAFAEKLGLNFPILSDPLARVAKLYGVYDDARKAARRTVFVVDQSGIVRHIEQSTSTIDTASVLNACKAIQEQ